MISDKTIDDTLLANASREWRKVAFVVGKTMLQIEPTQRAGLDDLYFAGRVKRLVKRQLLESNGDVLNLRDCEIRLTHPRNSEEEAK